MKSLRPHTLMVLFLVILLIGSSPPDGAERNTAVKGLFAFGWAQNFQETQAFELPYIDGFTAYTGWNLLEPREGTYDWSSLDTLLEKAKKSHKLLNIGVYPGSSAPQWLFEKYAVKPFRWRRQLKEDQARREGKPYQEKVSPLPWDPVFLEKWKNFIKALANRYGNEPSVGYIALSGLSLVDISMVIPLRDRESIDRLKKAGYSEDRIIRAWMDMMDYYARVLPGKKWALAVGPIVIGEKTPWAAYRLVDYGLRHYPENLIVMGVYLNDTWFRGNASKVTNSLIKKSGEFTTIGFQMAQSAHRNAQWKKKKPIVKSLRDSFENGWDLGISYLEVWHNSDIFIGKTSMPNRRYADDLKYIHAKLKSRQRPEKNKYGGDILRMYKGRFE